jgi:long-subunit fatty acid transport protein
MHNFRTSALYIAVTCFTLAGTAHATFEKTVPFSGKYAAFMGATSANVEGSQSLFFNPAGLAGKTGVEATVNFSPSWIQFQGPVNQDNQSLDTGKQFIPYGSVSASYGITEQWSFGLGWGAVGGSRALHKAVDFRPVVGAGFTMMPDLESKLSITEGDLGTAYEVIPGLTLGAAWRMTMVSGRFALPFVNTTTFSLNHLVIDDVKTTNYGGFRFGAQWEAADKSWGLGATWRTSIDFVGKGQSSGRQEAQTGGTIVDVAGGEATVGSTLPNRFSLGGFVVPAEKFTVIGDIVWSQYSKNKTIAIGGVLPANAGTSFPVALNWQDIWSFRVGFEYAGLESVALRAGYTLATQGTPNDSARATGAAPGTGQGFSLGAGVLLADNLTGDIAGEYSFSSGDGTKVGSTFAGTYKSSAMVIHSGISYAF